MSAVDQRTPFGVGRSYISKWSIHASQVVKNSRYGHSVLRVEEMCIDAGLKIFAIENLIPCKLIFSFITLASLECAQCRCEAVGNAS